ncbi:MAG TPA: hypothetical protein VHB25_12715, partial [Gemmatimonadaceae bacterium]|nr:hypothetical protein [Gemmatimonadaceae bacterium]
MKWYSRTITFVTAAALVLPVAAHGQVALTPMVGGYIPASDVNQVTGSAQNIAKTRDGTLALGLNLDLASMLRVSGLYASGTTLKNASKQDIGKGNVAAVAGDLVIRPLPRILVQPYLVAGAGEKFYKYDQNTTLASGGDAHAFA